MVHAIRGTASVPTQAGVVDAMRKAKGDVLAKTTALLAGEHACITVRSLPQTSSRDGNDDRYTPWTITPEGSEPRNPMVISVNVITSGWKMITLPTTVCCELGRFAKVEELSEVAAGCPRSKSGRAVMEGEDAPAVGVEADRGKMGAVATGEAVKVVSADCGKSGGAVATGGPAPAVSAICRKSGGAIAKLEEAALAAGVKAVEAKYALEGRITAVVVASADNDDADASRWEMVEEKGRPLADNGGDSSRGEASGVGRAVVEGNREPSGGGVVEVDRALAAGDKLFGVSGAPRVGCVSRWLGATAAVLLDAPRVNRAVCLARKLAVRYAWSSGASDRLARCVAATGTVAAAAATTAAKTVSMGGEPLSCNTVPLDKAAVVVAVDGSFGATPSGTSEVTQDEVALAARAATSVVRSPAVSAGGASSGSIEVTQDEPAAAAVAVEAASKAGTLGAALSSSFKEILQGAVAGDGAAVAASVVTGWLCTYGMVTRLLELKEAIVRHEEEEGLKAMLAGEDWAVLSLLRRVLEPFVTTQRALDSAVGVTGSLVVPVIFDLRASLKALVDALKGSNGGDDGDYAEAKAIVMPFILALQDYCSALRGDGGDVLGCGKASERQPQPQPRGGFARVRVLATALDPRTKTLYGIDDEEKPKLWNLVLEETLKIAQQTRKQRGSARASKVGFSPTAVEAAAAPTAKVVAAAPAIAKLKFNTDKVAAAATSKLGFSRDRSSTSKVGFSPDLSPAAAVTMAGAEGGASPAALLVPPARKRPAAISTTARVGFSPDTAAVAAAGKAVAASPGSAVMAPPLRKRPRFSESAVIPATAAKSMPDPPLVTMRGGGGEEGVAHSATLLAAVGGGSRGGDGAQSTPPLASVGSGRGGGGAGGRSGSTDSSSVSNGDPVVNSVQLELEAFRATDCAQMFTGGGGGVAGGGNVEGGGGCSMVNVDPLEWWRLRSAEFPNLANLARRVLAVPASLTATVASEDGERGEERGGEGEYRGLASRDVDSVLTASAASSGEEVALPELLRRSWKRVADWEALR